MSFVLRMAGREIRASWRRLLFFFVCVAIGVGSIVALRSILQSVRNGLAGEARALVSADVVVSSNRDWTPQLRAAIDARLAHAPVIARQDAIEMPTMVRPVAGMGADLAKMVELRAVQPAFPFYGTIVLEGGAPYSYALLRGNGALVRPELLAQLRLRVGDPLLIAGHRFTIRGVIAQEPGRQVGVFSFGSRVLVAYDDLLATKLLSFGSRASHQVLLRVKDAGVAPLVRQLRNDLRDRFVSVRSYQNTEDRVGDDLLRAENYLSLVGFVILVLGGIGVWSVTRVFVRQKIRSVAVLKCLGATTAQVLWAYVLQVVLLGLAGSALGVLLAWGAIAAIPPSIGAAFGGVEYGLTLSAVAQGVLIGLLVSLLFSLVPLLEVRRIRPLLLLRGGIAPAPAAARQGWWTPGGAAARLRGIDWTQAGAALGVSVVLVLVAGWQAASLKAGLIVCAGFAGLAIVLQIAGSAVVAAVRPVARARWFPLRHAVLSLGRPGNQTRVILLAVGLGSFFVIGVRSLQSNLLQQFSLELSGGGADMFLIEILPDQVEAVRAFLHDRKAPGSDEARLIPVMRARVTGVRGRDVNLSTFHDVRSEGSLAREYVITYRDRLEPNETVVAGRFWTGAAPLPEDAQPAQVSIERTLHDRFDIGLGDTIRFDIAGRPFDATVTSIRDVKWSDARNGGFMFVFRPGPFVHAPKTWIAILQAPADADARGRLQGDLVSQFPNVSVIDVREILLTVQHALANVTTAISIVGGVALVSGILILIGAVAMTKFQRIYEAAILRTLGASTRTLATMLALEYAGLGLLAGVIGGAGAIVLTWALTRHLLDIPWHPTPLVAAAGAAITTIAVAIVGVAASSDVLRRKPLATLRAE
ncbi:MAG TPA: FtsX-like permease family protein [Vicinamibacterales bacterium]|nr:FtsX-like permease family protein [Vicinamibacterales bacterium]